MNKRVVQFIVVPIFIIALLSILIIYFDTPWLAIGFLIITGLLAGVIRLLIFGYLNPSDWLYKFRFTLIGIGYGVFIGIMIFGMESIENQSFELLYLLKFLIIGALLGGVFNNSLSSVWLNNTKRRNRVFLLEKKLVKDFAQMVKPNEKRIDGELILSNKNLIFIGRRSKEKLLELDLDNINPGINKTAYLRIPNGIICENTVVFIIAFPRYWIKRIHKCKNLKA